MSVRIVTNNQPRPLLSFFELTDNQQAILMDDFEGLLTQEAIEDGTYFVYKGYVYSLSDFHAIRSEDFETWHAIKSETYFSGICIRISNGDDVVVGSYFS